MRITFLNIVLIFFILPIGAQLNPRFSQYTLNEFIINPAAAGVDGQTIFGVIGRKEWLGFSDQFPTPESYTFTAQTRILKHKSEVKSSVFGKYIDRRTGKVGLGISLIKDANGVFQQQGISMAYSYHVHFKYFQMSLGLATSIHQAGINSKYLIFKDVSQERYAYSNNLTSWIPDFGAGIYLKSRKYQLGASVSQLMQSKLFYIREQITTNITSISYKRCYYLTGLYINDLFTSPNWQYEPSFILRMYDFLQFNPDLLIPKYEADFMMRFIYKNKLWFGSAFRTTYEYVFLIGFGINNMNFSYSFDYGNNGISQYSYGSHEISISLKFGDDNRRYFWKERY